MSGQIATTASMEAASAPTPSDGKESSLHESSSKPYLPLFDAFGLTRESDKSNPRHNEALAKIWEYAKSIAPNKDKDSILYEVIHLKHRLGSSGLENNPYLKLEMYIKAHEQSRLAEDRMRELEAGN